ncbi:hypothetical protein ACFQL1_21040 [Halomicroarcula sp. GCM10025709]|uniref:hypothetical protein n=1 Tax=Haloarcula TaxID=2237 RepID=UPI0024C44595|nr:hypothetical protein [Halomicroarcula sp. YJ-61-S]
MHASTTYRLSQAPVVAFCIASVLALLAIYNYVTGVHGGAIVSGLGAIVASLFGVLVD